MPNILLPITPTYESVTRNVLSSVVHDIIERTGIDKVVPIYYRDAAGDVTLAGSTISKDGKRVREDIRWDAEDAVFISFAEEYVPTAVINTPVRHNEELLIFNDPALGASAKPVYSYTRMVIEFTYRCDTRHQMEGYLNSIKAHIGNAAEIFPHEVDLHYPVPKKALIILKHIYQLRERVSGYGDSYDTYMRSHMTPAIGMLVNQSGDESSSTLVVKQKQMGLTGWFEFEEPEAPEKEETIWQTTYRYVVEYQKPINLNLVYPLIVHNQLIDERLFSTESKPNHRTTSRNYESGRTRTALEVGPTRRPRVDKNFGGMQIPIWDEWLPRYITPSTATVFISAMLLDPENPTYLFDLSDIDDSTWTEGMWRLITTSEAPHMTRLGGSILYLQLYRADKPQADGILTVDDQGKVWSTEPLSLREQWRLRLSIITRAAILDEDAIDRLTEFPDEVIDIIDTVTDGGASDPGRNPWYPGGSNGPGNGGGGKYPPGTGPGSGGGSGGGGGGGGKVCIIGDYIFPDCIVDLIDEAEDYNPSRPGGGVRDPSGRDVESANIMDLTILFEKKIK